MRILIVSTSYYPATNGQAVFTTNLAEGLAKHGHDVMVIFPSDRIHEYGGIQNKVQLRGVRSIGFTRLHPDSFLPIFSAGKIQGIVNEFRPQVLHVQDHYPLSRAVLRAVEKFPGQIRKVGTNHFMPENLAPYLPFAAVFRHFYQWLLWNWMLGVYNRLDVVTAQSRIAARITRARGLNPPIISISCGLDLNRFHPMSNIDLPAYRRLCGLDPYQTTFLFVGRVDREKRLDVLLHALYDLGRKDIQLVIAGEGAALGSLQSLAASLDIEGQVRFTGFVSNDDLPILINSADIFTMPSEAELLSIATLEAMACGRPLLLANAVALPELVTQGVNGYLFAPGDPKDAAAKMKRLIDEPELWPLMGAASLERAQIHGLGETIQRYESLYESVLNNTTPAPRPDRFRVKYSSRAKHDSGLSK